MSDRPTKPGGVLALPDTRNAPLYSFIAYHGFLLTLLMFSSFNVYDLMIVFYVELIIIGFVALLRLTAGVLLGDPFSSKHVSFSIGARIVTGTFLAGFFVSKYGVLMLVLGIAIVLLPNELGISWADLTEIHPIVAWSLWFLIARYALLLATSTVANSDWRNESVIRLLVWPYLRGIWLGVSLALGFVLAAVYGDQNRLLFFTLGVFTARVVPDLIALLVEWRRRDEPLRRRETAFRQRPDQALS